MRAVICADEADTRALGRRLATVLGPGDIVLLAGDLGAGKTVLASAIGESLGVSERVVSPTFVLARRYEGLVPFVHADLYRAGSFAEIEDLALVEDAAEGVLVVEWGDAAEQAFPEDHLMIRITAADDGSRTVELVPHGSWRNRPLHEVVA